MKSKVDTTRLHAALANVLMFTTKGGPTKGVILLRFDYSGLTAFASDDFVCFADSVELDDVADHLMFPMSVEEGKTIEKALREAPKEVFLSVDESTFSVEWEDDLGEDVEPTERYVAYAYAASKVELSEDDQEMWVEIVVLAENTSPISPEESFSRFAVSPDRLSRLSRIKPGDFPIDFEQHVWAKHPEVPLLGFRAGPTIRGVLSPMDRTVLATKLPEGSLWI